MSNCCHSLVVVDSDYGEVVVIVSVGYVFREENQRSVKMSQVFNRPAALPKVLLTGFETVVYYQVSISLSCDLSLKAELAESRAWTRKSQNSIVNEQDNSSLIPRIQYMISDGT